MPNDRLNPCRAKIDRAKYHLQEFADRLDPSEGEQTYGLTFEIDSDSSELVVRSVAAERFFIDLSILAGEIIHHARSALDHAVWLLSKSPSAYVTGFPVYWPQPKYPDRDSLAQNKNYLAMFESTPDPVRAMINGFQPMIPAFKTNELYILNEMWKQEKHRLLNMVGVVTEACQVYFSRSDGRSVVALVELKGGPLENGTELARAALPAGFERDVQVMPVVVMAVKFSDAGPAAGRLAEKMLRELVRYAEFILFRLDEASLGLPPSKWLPPAPEEGF